ncbi:hypothetical protein L484_020278 [Morus notabilis]|uniref:Uncharacterized protein n=1 Tax=Morus notabilis TaxID=981085 RepID=W9QGW7_9ROSA|nr:hypothetical protein L484_020278 [Morus notabilis]
MAARKTERFDTVEREIKEIREAMKKEVGKVKAELIQSLIDLRRFWEEHVKNSSAAAPAPEKAKVITTMTDGGPAPINPGVMDELRAEVALGSQEENRAVDRRVTEEILRCDGGQEVPVRNQRGGTFGYRGDWWGTTREEGFRRNGGGAGSGVGARGYG